MTKCVKCARAAYTTLSVGGITRTLCAEHAVEQLAYERDRADAECATARGDLACVRQLILDLHSGPDGAAMATIAGRANEALAERIAERDEEIRRLREILHGHGLAQFAVVGAS